MQEKAPADAARAEALKTYQKLMQTQQSIMLATVSEDGTPLVSYAPFVLDDAQSLYIYVSSLAQHTANLEQSRQVSVMLIADEATSKQIFARERLTLLCSAEILPRDSDAWHTAATIYEARFGSFFSLIRGFADFKMFKLTPAQGSLVAGFGKAYTLSSDSLGKTTLSPRK